MVVPWFCRTKPTLKYEYPSTWFLLDRTRVELRVNPMQDGFYTIPSQSQDGIYAISTLGAPFQDGFMLKTCLKIPGWAFITFSCAYMHESLFHSSPEQCNSIVYSKSERSS